MRFISFICLGLAVAVHSSDMPPPFSRELRLTSPPMNGKDVFILQNFLARNVTCSVTSNYDEQTATAVKAFQKSTHQLPGFYFMVFSSLL